MKHLRLHALLAFALAVVLPLLFPQPALAETFYANCSNLLNKIGTANLTPGGPHTVEVDTPNCEISAPVWFYDKNKYLFEITGNVIVNARGPR